MLGFGNYFWRLIPANPILLRVVEAAGRRRRDLFIRCGYLGLLIFLVIFSLVSSGTGGATLGDLAKTSAGIFQNMSYLQLGLVALLAPIFTAGAITQEKDSQTYDILLATPLSNGQIVLGSLLSRIFFVIALLISGIPIFSITQIFGGVAIGSIAMSFAISAATAFVTGALAMAIATFKVGTRRTIFSFYMFVVIYLVGLYLLDMLPFFQVQGRQVNPQTPSHISWFTGIHPFLALRVVLSDPSYVPPELGSLPPHLQRWPIGWYLSSPATFYVWFMFALSAVLILPAILMLRKLAQSTTSAKTWFLKKLHLSKGETRRKPRYVWANPIAWREAKTKASAARASVMRYGFMAAGIIGAVVLVSLFAQQQVGGKYITSSSYDSTRQTLTILEGDKAETLQVGPATLVTFNGEPANLDDLNGRFAVREPVGRQGKLLTSIDVTDIDRKISVTTARNFLLGAIIVEFAVILLIVTNAAASTVTREKEDGSLDLLLTTPITSRYYIWGKLRGLVSYVLPLVAVPVASVLIFILYDLTRIPRERSAFRWMVFPEAIIIMPGLLIMVAAFASILGMQMSLRCRTTVRAVMSSVGIVIGLCGGLGWCGTQFIGTRGGGVLALILGSFSPFTVLTVLIDPVNFGGSEFATGSTGVASARIIVLVFSWIATGVYGLIVWSMYKSMVKNFDMTIRRQSR
ncbi:MAG TPA: ABC transporter permease subunit [Tepidisphaeraceae bacterium]|nr:ABC transporter permease subunit [Tepidisphaeraceae bacterium]